MEDEIAAEWVAKYLKGDSRLQKERTGILRLNTTLKRIEFAVEKSNIQEDDKKSLIIVVAYPLKFLNSIEIIQSGKVFSKKSRLQLTFGESPNEIIPQFSLDLHNIDQVIEKIKQFQEHIKNLPEDIIKEKTPEEKVLEFFSNLLVTPINQFQNLLSDVSKQLISFTKIPKKIFLDPLQPKPSFLITEIENNGRIIRYFDSQLDSRKSDDVLIFLPSIGTDVYQYEKLAEGISRSIRVIIPYLRGFDPEITLTEKSFSVKDFCQDLGYLLDSFDDTTKIYLASHSLSAAIVFHEFLKPNYTCIKKFIIISSSAQAPKNFRNRVKALPPPLTWGPFKKEIKKIVPTVLFDKKSASEEVINNFIEIAFSFPDSTYYSIFKNWLPKYSYVESLKNLKKPLLLIHGSSDQLIPTELYDELDTIVDNKYLTRKVTKGGHMLPLENPQKIANLISSFIKPHRTRIDIF